MIREKKFKGIAVCFFAAALSLFLCACSSQATQDTSGIEQNSPSKGSSIVRIGTMPTEDILPVWVAEDFGMFAEHGQTVEVETFDSASALSAALVSGQVDMAMTDVMRAVKLCESGCSVNLEWVTLGTDSQQGRFGIMTNPESGINSLSDLVESEKGVGVAANTVPEYVFYRLCEEAGIDPESIKTVEVASLPDRYTLMAEGQIDAAALPGSLLAVGENSGLVTIADDFAGENVSQSVMVARSSFAADHAEALVAIAKAWDTAAAAINADPEAFRDILIQKAGLNTSIADTYPINMYPYALNDQNELLHPTKAMVDPVLDWMARKGYAAKSYMYDVASGAISAM